MQGVRGDGRLYSREDQLACPICTSFAALAVLSADEVGDPCPGECTLVQRRMQMIDEENRLRAMRMATSKQLSPWRTPTEKERDDLKRRVHDLERIVVQQNNDIAHLQNQLTKKHGTEWMGM